jgi:DNA-binding XRE family transcriptional regulator
MMQNSNKIYYSICWIIHTLAYKNNIMLDKYNKVDNSISDKALLELIGTYLKETRLRQNKTQMELAEAAGINRSTLVQIESGGGGGLLTFVQIMRALDQLSVFKNFEISEQISPLLLAKIQRNKRQRASGASKTLLPK